MRWQSWDCANSLLHSWGDRAQDSSSQTHATPTGLLSDGKVSPPPPALA